jgi:hypothetical protein
MGNDLVRFIDTVIGRPTYVSGLSSGGVLSAWLSAYAKPGQVVAALYEDPPVRDLLRAVGVAVEYRSFPEVGHSMHGDQPDLYVDTVLDWVKSLDV